MIFLFGIFICVLWCLITFWLDRIKYNDCKYAGGRLGSFIIGIIMLFLTVLIPTVGRYSQFCSFEEYRKINKNIEILSERKDKLTTLFSGFLSDKYINQESKLFENMSTQDADLLFTKFPEIKSNLTLTELVNKIMELNTDYYNCKLELNKISLLIKTRYRDPTLIGFVLPDVPPDITVN